MHIALRSRDLGVAHVLLNLEDVGVPKGGHGGRQAAGRQRMVAYISRSPSPRAAWAAARRAMGMRSGEQLT